MGIARGTNIVRDGLVFGYDTGYGVSDNNTTTRFYPGEVTTNQADTDALRNWGTHGGAASSTTTAPEKGLGWKKLTITNIYGSNYRLAQFPYRVQASGTNRTYSVEYDVTGLTGYFLFVDGSAGYSQTSISGRGRYSFTTGVISGSKSLAIFIGKSGTHNNINDVIYYKEYQVEVKGHATPFTATSRSSTQSLIDLKKTTNIDVSNVSFDSTGQPTFDGTNDEIQLPSSDWNKVTAVTVEAVVKINGAPIDGNGYHVVVQKDGAYSGGSVYGIRISDSGVPYGTFSTGNTSSTTHVDTVAGSAMTSNKYYHLVYTRKVSESVFYQNGTPIDTSTSSSGVIYNNTSTVTIGQGDGRQLYGDISIVKIYNKVLTASEIKQNFNAYKNRFNI